MVEEHINPSMTVQTEFEEWVESGCKNCCRRFQVRTFWVW